MGPFVELENGMLVNLSYVVSIIPSYKEERQDAWSDKIEIKDTPNRYIYVTRRDLRKVVRALQGYIYKEQDEDKETREEILEEEF